MATLALADAAPLPLSQTEVIPICQAFDRRRRGERLRLKAVASDSRFRAGLAPSGQAMAGLIE